ncbi:hypothetical protein M9H77_27960 [Catharanthus roseus]|uniref:Uncharacterized protein n=1 Tax=Catharanthus roseus TaxID=4058 RepID=A0ACC0AFF0_CATRO|nr:hypothetical protein M9H77_27960 [Catharanthus roseus]
MKIIGKKISPNAYINVSVLKRCKKSEKVMQEGVRNFWSCVFSPRCTRCATPVQQEFVTVDPNPFLKTSVMQLEMRFMEERPSFFLNPEEAITHNHSNHRLNPRYIAFLTTWHRRGEEMVGFGAEQTNCFKENEAFSTYLHFASDLHSNPFNYSNSMVKKPCL